MDHHLVVGVIVVVQAWFVLAQDKIRLEADYVVEEAAELVNFRTHSDIGARVLNQIHLKIGNLFLQTLALIFQALDFITELENCEVIVLRRQLLLICYSRL